LGSIEGLEQPRTRAEKGLGLTGARVVLANYELLQSDFTVLANDALFQANPRLLELSGDDRLHAIRQIIDGWLLANAAFISEPQAQQQTTNTKIQTNAECTQAWRPPLYGRAWVLTVRRCPDGANTSAGDSGAGLLDVKGIGVGPGIQPGNTGHSNGLLVLGEAIREFLFEKLLRGVFRHAQVGFEVLPIYAVLSTGFEVTLPDGLRPAAGLLVRRAHRRPVHRFVFSEFGSQESAAEMEIEFILRRYGITSSGSGVTIEIRRTAEGVQVRYGGVHLSYLEHELKRIEEHAGFDGPFERFEGLNIQFTEELQRQPARIQIVDLGSFRVKESFTRPVVSLVSDRLVYMGEIVRPGDPNWVRLFCD
jgi:hypothetical protein